MELRSQCFCIPLQCFPKQSFSLVSVRHRVKRGWKADMLWSTQAPSDLCRAASRAEAKWPVFGRRALQASRGSETSSRRYYKALLRGETQVAGPAWRSPGPQLSAGRATSHGPRGGAGGQLCGREEGSFAVQSCCGCLDLLPATTRFTPDLSNKVASLSTGRNQSRTVVASLSSTGVSQGLPSYRRPRYEESATKRGHLEPI